jgi:hypothetical protein
MIGGVVLPDDEEAQGVGGRSGWWRVDATLLDFGHEDGDGRSSAEPAKGNRGVDVSKGDRGRWRAGGRATNEVRTRQGMGEGEGSEVVDPKPSLMLQVPAELTGLNQYPRYRSLVTRQVVRMPMRLSLLLSGSEVMVTTVLSR